AGFSPLPRPRILPRMWPELPAPDPFPFPKDSTLRHGVISGQAHSSDRHVCSSALRLRGSSGFQPASPFPPDSPQNVAGASSSEPATAPGGRKRPPTERQIPATFPVLKANRGLTLKSLHMSIIQKILCFRAFRG
ncbi:MAG: hypothetical protein WCT05_06525, partial [Lentisphaeria bacterium]